ncbi:secretory subunit [Dimargaris xerosporica]|nr:secretory subunit [Dimargaris xerosporica]
MKYTFDESGVGFNYYLLSFLVLTVVPTTLSQLFARVSRNNGPKTKKHYTLKKRLDQKPLITKKLLFIVVGWAAIAYLVNQVLNTPVEPSTAWDPFDILGVSTGATPAEIKKQYRRLSLQWHPDKVDPEVQEEAGDKYIQITKAYKVLTNDDAREMYEKYGHPDGRQTYEMIIALPHWLVESHTSPFVLAVYGLIFGLLMPMFVGRWWYRSMRLTKNGIYNTTMGLFFKELKEGATVPDILELLTASTEYTLNPGYQPEDDKAIAKLAERVKEEVERVSGEAFLRSEKYPSDVAYKAKVLLYAHLYRVDVAEDRLREQQQIVVIKALHLMVGIQHIFEAYSWLQPTFYAIEIAQMLVQAVPQYDSPLLQLPHVDRDLVEEVNARKPTAANVFKLLDLDKSERRHLLHRLPAKQYDEAVSVMNTVPRVFLRNPTFKVIGDSIITPRAIITFTVDITLNGANAPITPVTPKAPKMLADADRIDPNDVELSDDKDDGVDRLMANPQSLLAKVPEVYAPYYSLTKHSFWWLVLGDPKSNRFTLSPIRITDLSSSKSIKVQFQAPNSPGTYALTMFLKSDSYMGCDLQQKLEFVVHNASELPYESEPDDDISEPEADSLAGQMAQMRNQQAGGGKQPDDDTSDDE